MARTTLTKTTAGGAFPTAGTTVTMTAADVGNGNQFAAGGKDLVILRNSGSTERTFTLTSVADPYGRSGTITTEALAAGAVKVLGPLPKPGWMQTDGYIYISASHAEVLIGVISLP